MEVLGRVVVFFYDEDFSTVFFFLCNPEFFSPGLSYFFQRLASNLMIEINFDFDYGSFKRPDISSGIVTKKGYGRVFY